MSKYKIVIVSKDDTYKFNESMCQKTLSSHIHEIDIEVLKNNSDFITKVYNKFIDANKDKYDFIIFMHADVALDGDHLIDHIEKCKDKYDIMGLCGTSIMNVSQSPLNWWTGSNPTPYSKWGCVTHGELGNQKSFFSADRANVTDHEVSCIDGLCIIISKNAIDSGIRFDEQFEFDQYDTDFSFQAFMTYKLKIGVLIEQSLQHYSVGRSILTEDFLRHEADLRKKWNLPIVKKQP